MCVYCEYFNNFNRDEDMMGTRICTSSSPSPYPIEKVENFPYQSMRGFFVNNTGTSSNK